MEMLQLMYVTLSSLLHYLCVSQTKMAVSVVHETYMDIRECEAQKQNGRFIPSLSSPQNAICIYRIYIICTVAACGLITNIISTRQNGYAKSTDFIL